jgi:molybdenum-dependent DNA-binding transcriptional regulator ModE
MLEQLLNEIHVSGSLQPPVLAKKLGTSVTMVEAMLESLERMGRLRVVDTSCGDSCGGCPLSSGCAAAGGRGRMWMTTPRKQDGA